MLSVVVESTTVTRYWFIKFSCTVKSTELLRRFVLSCCWDSVLALQRKMSARKRKRAECFQDDTVEPVTGVAAFKRPAVFDGARPPPRKKKLTIDQAKEGGTGA